MYWIELPREAATLYLTWEVGERLAAEFLANFIGNPVRIPCGIFRDTPVRNRQEAEAYLTRARCAVAYQQGRAGKELAQPEMRLVKQLKPPRP